MNSAGWLLLLAVLAVVGLLLQNRAGRMDRLHLRLDAARQALEAQLLRRATAALELAASNRLDPATTVVLADAAQQAINADDAARASAESDLSQVLRAIFDDADVGSEVTGDPVGEALVREVNRAAERTVYAHRFHNDAVAAAQRLRRTRSVRWFRLAGHAPWPEPFEADTQPPAT